MAASSSALAPDGYLKEFARLASTSPAGRMRPIAAFGYLLRVVEFGRTDEMTMLPKTVQRPHPPLWGGGISVRAMRRAVELADGWDSGQPHAERLEPAVHRLRELCLDAGRDPTTMPVAVRGIVATRVNSELIATYEALGVTDLVVMLPLGDPPQALSVLEELADRCRDHLVPTGTATT